MNLEIANRLQKLRKEKGYSQEQLAEALGISRQAVSKWERAESSPDTDNLICLAKLYGVSLDELLSTEANIEEIIESNEVVEETKNSKTKKEKIVDLLQAISLSVIGILYFVLGFFFNLWHPTWIIFLFIPINSSIIEAIANKDIEEFAYPVLLAAIYLFCGTVYHLWHPMWVIFITIPIYYGILEYFEKDKK